MTTADLPPRLRPRSSSDLLAPAAEAELVECLRNGNETAFAAVVDRYHPSLVRVAMSYVRERSVAEEVAQETWLVVLRGIDRFERRSSFQTWLFRILTNRAKTRAKREARSLPFSALAPDEDLDEAERFRPADAPQWPGGWMTLPALGARTPEERLLATETRTVILRTISRLPANHRAVITLRDIEGLDAADVCTVLGLTDTNQRVLLHRARSKLRHALVRHFA